MNFFNFWTDIIYDLKVSQVINQQKENVIAIRLNY